MSTIFFVWVASAAAAYFFIRGATADGAQETTMFSEEFSA